MERKLVIEYEVIEDIEIENKIIEDGIKVLSVIDSEKDEVLNMFNGEEAREVFEFLTKVIEDKRVPYYDSMNKTWRVITEYGEEEGDAVYIASEFVKSGLCYPFHSEPAETERYPSHVHDFASVVSFLLDRPKFFSIAGFEEYYSQQERDLLDKIKAKFEKNNNYMY